MILSEQRVKRFTLEMSQSEFGELQRILRMAAVHVGKYDLPEERGVIRRWMTDLKMPERGETK